jgi:LemA protein
VQNKWSDVETNYQRRTDLYSSVIKTIEGSANFEKSTLKEVVDARARATSVRVDVNDSDKLATIPAGAGSTARFFQPFDRGG